MKLKIVLLGICIFLFVPNSVFASSNVEARIGNEYYDTLELAIFAASSTDVINLMSDVVLSKTLEINKTVHINLNNHTIQAEERVFLVHGGSLVLKGKGIVKETKPNYGAIVLKGSNNAGDKDFTTVSVGSEVTLEGWSGIFINQYNKTGYGILVNMNGSINAVDDINGSSGAGIYVNGSIQHINNSPIINLSNTTNITSTGSGIYAAGYATYYINGAYIEGEESGIGIKSGEFQIIDGTIVGSGPDKTPTSGNNNGINSSGTSIQIESNNGYKGNIDLNIKNGSFKSVHSNVIYEYTVNNIGTKVQDISISGGSFISEADKDVLVVSNSFQSTHDKFITGGSFSSDPSNYVSENYAAKKTDNLYEVISDDVSVFLEIEGKSNSVFKILFGIIGISIIVGVIYFLKNKVII